MVKTAIVIKETRQYQRQDCYVCEIRLIFKQKSCFLIYRESKAEWQCKISIAKHESDGLWSIKWKWWTMINKMKVMDYNQENESDGLWSIKWKWWTMVDEMNGMEFDMWAQQRWGGGKMI